MKQGGEGSSNKPLIQRQANELRQNFEQIKRLFEFADNKLDPDRSYDEYVGRAPGNGEQHPKLPTELSNIAAAYPGEYSVVYYTNRNSSYYAEGTRGRTVGLSTAEKRSQSNERVREIDFREPGADEHDPRMYMTVTEMVNEKSFESINTAGEGEIERPHGSAKMTFALNHDGTREIAESAFSRLDEGLFNWRGTQTPVRWLRRLNVSNTSPGVQEVTYEDSYIIGRNESGHTDERAQIRTKIRGTIDAPESIRVEIGIGGGVSGTMIYEDPVMQVFINNPFGSHRSEAEILAQDPSYAFLVRGAKVEKERLLSVIQSKIRMLQEDWDKPHPVFGTAVGESSPQQLR